MKASSPLTAERLTVSLSASDVATRDESFDTTDAKGRALGMYIATGTLAVGPGPVGYACYDLRGKQPFGGAVRLPVGMHYFARLQTTRGGTKFGAYKPEVYFTTAQARDEYVARRIAAAHKRAWKGEPCLEAGTL